jgi:guanosine-3',5'-bis(diphosphate) 3'-pyrophosphohydrolase
MKSPWQIDGILDLQGCYVAIYPYVHRGSYCSEEKTDVEGRKRPWIDRKRDHLACMASAPVEARAVILADKLQNLISIEIDLREGRPVWTQFHADRASVLSYYRQAIEVCTAGDPRLAPIASKAQETLTAVDTLGE